LLFDAAPQETNESVRLTVELMNSSATPPNSRSMLRTTTFSLIATLLTMLLTPDITRAADETHQQVPFFDDGVMIRVPSNAFGKRLYFLVDSGFTFSVIDAGYKQFLGEPITAYSGGSPLGTDTTLPALHCPEMSIAGKALGLDRITCLDLKMPRFISGQQCDGILGMDFFAKNIVSINFDNNIFSVIKAVPET